MLLFGMNVEHEIIRGRSQCKGGGLTVWAGISIEDHQQIFYLIQNGSLVQSYLDDSATYFVRCSND